MKCHDFRMSTSVSFAWSEKNICTKHLIIKLSSSLRPLTVYVYMCVLKLTCALPFDTTLLSVFMSKQVIWCSLSGRRRHRTLPTARFGKSTTKFTHFTGKTAIIAALTTKNLPFYHFDRRSRSVLLCTHMPN